MQNASIVVAAMLIAACGHQADGPCADVPPAISNVSVSSTGTPTTTSLRWSARQGPNLVTKQFDPQEIQLFLSDVSECGGTVVPTREITMFIYAYALPRGAIPATYPIGQNGAVGPAFGLFFTSGMGEFLNDPTGQVTLTRVDSCVAEGTFEVTTSMAKGGAMTLAGNFVAPFCAAR
jgi:hypothetical protein